MLALYLSAAALAAAPSARAETVAGVTAGALSVEASGSASYSVPIAVPPGVAGMEPDLSLIYNSRGDNGTLGVGWSVGGLSIIHRCPKTLVQDNTVGGVNFDADDRFCLDGQRLIAISGVYGADGTEYRTEIDGFARIVSHGTAGSGPAYFTLETKAGQTMEYGATADARMPIPGRDEARFWALNRVEDTVGNYMTLHYWHDWTTDDTCRIDRIEYAGNTAAGTVPQSTVQFLYEARPDTREVYQAGARINMAHRMTGIQASTDGALVRDYRFAYETSPSTPRSRLLSITECDGTGDCLAPISLDWTQTAAGWAADTTYELPELVFLFSDSNPAKRRGQFVDVNGDGRLDWVRAHTNVADNRTYLHTDNGWVESPAHRLPTIIHAGFITYGDFLDVNGDGLRDWVYSFRNPADNVTYLNTGDGWVESAAHRHPSIVWEANGGVGRKFGEYVDVNGDGLLDWVKASGNIANNVTYLNTGSGWVESPTYQLPDVIRTWNNNQPREQGAFVDVNGDGRLDWVHARSATNENRTYLSTDGGWVESPAHTLPVLIYFGFRRQGEFVDVNGDGLRDWVHAYGNATNNVTYLNSGKGWVESPAHALPVIIRTANDGKLLERGQFVDLNGDGLLDFLQSFANVANNTAFLSIGNGWEEDPAYALPSTELLNIGSRTFAVLVDINGDGVDDYVKSYQADGKVFKATLLSRAAAPDLLERTTDSLGRDTTITYAPLTDPGVHTKGTGAVFPEQEVQGPFYVVKEVSSDDGLGGQARTTYGYEGARSHVQGRGFLGFARMTSADEQTGIETITDYRQDFPFIGRVEFTDSSLADGTLVKLVADTWDEKPLNGGLTTFPFVAQSQAQSFEINDGPGNLAVTTVTTTNAYDDFGNPTSIVATTVGGGETFKKTTTNVYTNDEVNWFLGRLIQATVKSELPDLSFETRVSAFDYDPATGLLRQEVVEPDLPAFTLTTDYGHDAFGNVTTETVSGGDIVTRTRTTEFSADGRFAIKVINDLGQDETRAYDARFGTVTSLTGPNRIITTWAFDGFGRKTREAREDGTETRTSYELCTTQCPAGGVYAVSRQDLNSASLTPIGPRSVEYFDALNRVFRSESEGFDGTRVFVDTEFNARGETIAVTRPYFEGTAPADIQKTVTTYDDVGRPLSVTQPDGGVTTTDYDGLTATSTNALDQTETRRNNAIGELVEVTDNLGTRVTYKHDHFGNLEQTVRLVQGQTTGLVTTMIHDIRGRKTSMDDLDMGVWTYEYNVLGELIFQRDAKGQEVRLEYDTLGRLTLRDEPEGISRWFYDTAAKGVGKLHSVTAPGDYLQTLSYDGLGRHSGTTTTIDGVVYSSGVTYDGAGRIETQTYPSGFAVQNAYNARGFLTSVSEEGGSTVFWQADSVNAEGQVTRETFGNGVTTARAYDPKTALIETIKTDLAGSVAQDLAYDFDKLGNLKQRRDLFQDRREDFLYDGLNRLTSATLVDTAPGGGTRNITSYGYNALGNLTFKSDVGAYTYGGGGAGPHAVTDAGGKVYVYDANGNMTERRVGGAAELTVAYASFNKPALITDTTNSNEAGFTYGPDRARIQQRIVENSVAREVVYLGGLYERRTRFGSPDELVHYIVAGSTVAIHTIHDDNLPATNKARYLHRDHLGSIESITSETGAVIERLSFDAHGKRRLADWTAGDPADPDAETPRGFTGHEHLDAVGLIHMNGRVYDPALGRFLSADPFVQAPETTQSFNRYSYVNNNPLSYTDPSGFFFKKIGKAFKGIANIAKSIHDFSWKATKEVLQNQWARLGIQVVLSVAVPGIGGLVASAAFAGLATIANGGSLMDAVMSAGITAGSALAFSGVNAAFRALPKGFDPIAKQVLKTLAHGVVGGVSSVARGGKFHTGFLSAGLTQAAAPGIDFLPRNLGTQAIASAVVGGAGAALGGGKFVNGAASGAFAYMLGNIGRVMGPTLSRGAGGVAFVGGAADHTIKGAAYTSYLEYSGKDAAYFTFDQAEELAAWIDAHGPAVTVVPHSYGADTAAAVIAAGHPVDTLITVDPVSNFGVGSWFGPGYEDVARYADNWINYVPLGGQGSFPNFIASLGGVWGTGPTKHTTFNILSVNDDHATIMNRCVIPGEC